jgi:hypothetical protein
MLALEQALTPESASRPSAERRRVELVCEAVTRQWRKLLRWTREHTSLRQLSDHPVQQARAVAS